MGLCIHWGVFLAPDFLDLRVSDGCFMDSIKKGPWEWAGFPSRMACGFRGQSSWCLTSTQQSPVTMEELHIYASQMFCLLVTCSGWGSTIHIPVRVGRLWILINLMSEQWLHWCHLLHAQDWVLPSLLAEPAHQWQSPSFQLFFAFLRKLKASQGLYFHLWTELSEFCSQRNKMGNDCVVKTEKFPLWEPATDSLFDDTVAAPGEGISTNLWELWITGHKQRTQAIMLKLMMTHQP